MVSNHRQFFFCIHISVTPFVFTVTTIPKISIPSNIAISIAVSLAQFQFLLLWARLQFPHIYHFSGKGLVFFFQFLTLHVNFLVQLHGHFYDLTGTITFPLFAIFFLFPCLIGHDVEVPKNIMISFYFSMFSKFPAFSNPEKKNGKTLNIVKKYRQILNSGIRKNSSAWEKSSSRGRKTLILKVCCLLFFLSSSLEARM